MRKFIFCAVFGMVLTGCTAETETVEQKIQTASFSQKSEFWDACKQALIQEMDGALMGVDPWGTTIHRVGDVIVGSTVESFDSDYYLNTCIYDLREKRILVATPEPLYVRSKAY